MRDSYWEPRWRREHRGREHDLWEAVEGYLDLHDAAQLFQADRPGPRPPLTTDGGCTAQ